MPQMQKLWVTLALKCNLSAFFCVCVGGEGDFLQKKNKIWSLVSLSKTFALGSLESLKLRSSVLSLQRSFSLKFIWVRKKIWV